MQEIDIWIKVFDILGFKFIEESHNIQSRYNYLKYEKGDNIGTVNFRDNKKFTVIYFNYETGRVTSLIESSGILNKKLFYNQYIDLFREVKLKELSIK